MKKTAGWLFLLPVFLLTGCQPGETKREEIEYAGLPCVVVEDRASEKIMDLFRQMQTEGREEGYSPLIILRDEQTPGGRSVLDDWMEVQAEDHRSLPEYTEQLLMEYKGIDADEYFERMSDYYLEQVEWEAGDEYGDEVMEPDHELYTAYVEQIYIAKVPTDLPYEVLAYLPMGGYNDCPMPEEHLAIAKKWYEEYGAVPCAVSYDTVQYYLELPVTDEDALTELKREQFIYCYDIVTQGVGSLEYLKQSLDGSSIWFFWWD